jgi:hypothetical protein
MRPEQARWWLEQVPGMTPGMMSAILDEGTKALDESTMKRRVK